MYIIKGDTVLIYRHLDNYEYDPNRIKFKLETLYTSKYRINEIAIDDTVFLTENGCLKIYNSKMIYRNEIPISNKRGDYFSILCVGSRIYVCISCKFFKVYNILY